MKRLMAVFRSSTDLNTPCFNRLRVSLAKKPSTAFSQELDVGMLVGAVIVEDRMDFLTQRHLPLDLVKKAQKLLVPMALHIL